MIRYFICKTVKTSRLKKLQIRQNINNLAYVPSHLPIFDWNLIKQIYYKKIFIKHSFQRFRQRLKSTFNSLFMQVYILFHTKKCMLLNMSAKFVIKDKPFSIYVEKPLNNSYIQ